MIFISSFKFVFIITIYCLFLVAHSLAATVSYSKEGVKRIDSDEQCDITFINFGTEEDVTNIKVEKPKPSGKINTLKLLYIYILYLLLYNNIFIINQIFK